MSVPFAVVRSRRAKHVRLRIDSVAEVEIVVPVGAQVASISELLHEHGPWIARHVLALAQCSPAMIRDGVRIKYQGETLRLSVTRGHPVAAEQRGDVLFVTVVSEAHIVPVIDTWFRRQAWLIIGTIASSVAQSMELRFSGITVRDQRTRWGSCSEGGRLSFSWRLLLAPPEVMRYVVVHEVAHLREPNHGAEFWSLVALHCPEYREHRQWLRQEGASLRSIAALEARDSSSS